MGACPYERRHVHMLFFIFFLIWSIVGLLLGLILKLIFKILPIKTILIVCLIGYVLNSLGILIF